MPSIRIRLKIKSESKIKLYKELKSEAFFEFDIFLEILNLKPWIFVKWFSGAAAFGGWVTFLFRLLACLIHDLSKQPFSPSPEVLIH